MSANASIRRGPDLISSLPDTILHHILGFLKTKEAVQTCVLSKRWEHLWVSVPSLHFDLNDFVPRDQLDNLLLEFKLEEHEIIWQSCSEKFVKFVNAVLFRREPFDLEVFHLSCKQLCWEHWEQARHWIHYATKHHARVFHFLYFVSLPGCIFTCTSVEELHLIGYEEHISGTVYLPKLKKLVMCQTDIQILFPRNLLSGCLILECLELEDYTLPDGCVIANEHLKHLCITNCDAHQLSIDAPNLLSFSFSKSPPSCGYPYQPPPHETILNMPSLMFAQLDISCFRMIEHLEAATSILGAVSNAEVLKLYVSCNQPKELHGVQLQELPIFHKLKNVIVAFCALASFETVAWILNSSPNLKKLTLVEQSCSLDEMGATTSESTDVSLLAAITSCKELEIIEVKYQKGCDQMVGQLVNALINATKELENLKIHLVKYKSC